MPAPVDIAPVIIAAADPHPRPPGWPVAPGGWDTHAHVFGPHDAFPLPSPRLYTPPEQTAADYLALLDVLGLRHGVLVQPSVYGADHACLLHALATAPGRLAGVVDLDVTAAPDSVLARMTVLGVQGMRMRWPNAGGPTWLHDCAARLRELGWHLDLLPETLAATDDVAPHLARLGVPVMIEAMGDPRAGEPVAAPGFQALLRLLRDGVAWVKLSHFYRIDGSGPPYGGVVPFARAIVETAPNQAVWGSDWPHPMRDGTMPNDGDLLGLLPGWAGGVLAANRILRENAQRFYTRKEIAS